MGGGVTNCAWAWVAGAAKPWSGGVFSSFRVMRVGWVMSWAGASKAHVNTAMKARATRIVGKYTGRGGAWNAAAGRMGTGAVACARANGGAPLARDAPRKEQSSFARG